MGAEFGKRCWGPPVVSSVGPPQLLVRDTCSGVDFLVDTGAQVSLVPPSFAQQYCLPALPSPAPPPALFAANGCPIAVHAVSRTSLCIAGVRYDVSFIVADVTRPILGADFLREHNLLVDLRGGRLVDPVNFRSVLGSPVTAHYVSPVLLPQNRFEQLLAEYPTVTTPTFSAPVAAHGVQHHIETRGPPVHCKVRRLNPERLRIAKEEFSAMQSLGIIRKSKSAWASPLHLVPKAGGKWRAVGDYRRLNNVTIPDRYPVPHLTDFTANLAGCRVFTKLDLIRGYHQIPVAPEDICKTAVLTPFGLWEYVKMNFGLRNGAQTLQRLMDEILRDLPFCFVYIDDILVASPDLTSHEDHVRQVLQRLSKFGMILRPEKCVFAVEQIEFLGHLVSPDGCRPLPSKVAAILEAPRPETKRELQGFIGSMNFYHRFVPHLSGTLGPLFAAVASARSRTSVLQWTPEMIDACEAAKHALADATLLVHPRPHAVLALSTDASDVGIGAVLEQLQDNVWHPLGFFSRQLSDREKRYSAFDRELHALHAAVKHFRFTLEGRTFVALTDHAPLVDALVKKGDPLSAVQQRKLSFLSEFDMDLRHVSGKDNLIADWLSRAPAAAAVHLSVDPAALAAAQSTSAEIKALQDQPPRSLRLEQVVFPNGLSLLCDTSLGHPRPLLPPQFRRAVFNHLHSLSHPGAKATILLLTRSYVWPGIRKDVRRWCRECVLCAASKIQTHYKAPLEPLPTPEVKFAFVHVDIVGPLPHCQGYTHVLTCIDRATRWVEVFPLRDITAETCTQEFIAGWVSRFGVPLDIVSDRGGQFVSRMWAAMAASLGSTTHSTNAFHPQSNGLVERFHRSLKAALKARLDDQNWVAELPWVLLGLRSSPKEDLGCSPAELVFGTPPLLPGEFIVKTPSIPPQQRAPRHHAHPCATDLLPLLRSKFVFVRVGGQKTPLQRPYMGPFRVEEPGPKSFRVRMGSSLQTVSIDRLKPAFVAEDTAPLPYRTRSGRLIHRPSRFDN